MRKSPLSLQGSATVFDKPYILLRDKEYAEKATRVLGLPLPRQLHTTPCRVLKGQLVTAIPPEDRVQRNDSLMPHNYRTLTRDSPATFYHDDAAEHDLCPLTPNDYDILAGIKSTYVRFQYFIEGGRLEWATKLKKGDKVMVELPVEGGGATPIQPCSSALYSSSHTESVIYIVCHPLHKAWFSLTEERSAGISGVCDGDVSLDWSPVLWISLPHWLLGLPLRHSRSHVSTTVTTGTPHTLTPSPDSQSQT